MTAPLLTPDAAPAAADTGLDQALLSLLRFGPAELDATLRALAETAARALGAPTAAVWLRDAHGEPLAARARWPIPADGDADAEDGADDAPRPERLDALQGRRVLVDGGGAVLEAGVWRAGEVAGVLRVERPAGAPWSAAERALAATLADRVALEVERGERLRAERRLAERERHVDEVEALSQLGSWEWDLAADRITWSQEQLRIHGLDRETGPRDFEAFLQRVHPEDRGRVAEECMRLVETGRPFSFHYRVVRPDGSQRLLHAMGQMMPDPAGRSTRMVGTSQDVTERRRTEDALRASEARFRDLFEQYPESVQIFSPEGRTLQVNRAYTRLWGVGIEQMGEFNPLTDPQLEPVRDEIRRGFAGETVMLPAARYDGSQVPADMVPHTEWPRWVQGFMFPLRDDRGTMREVIIVHQDVTEQKKAEEALRASEESYRTIFDSSNDAIFVHDLATGAILDANRRACELAGVSLGEMRTRGLEVVGSGPAPHFTRERALEHIARAATGLPQRFEWLSYRPDTGAEVWAEVSLQRVSILGEDRLLALVRDIRERKEAELALRQSEESYRTIFQHSSDAIWLHDLETGAFLEVNQAACEMYGYTEEETRAIGVQGLSDGREPYTLERARAFMEKAAAGEPQRFEWLGRHRDGRPVWGEVQLRRVNIRGVDRLLATARDIADRKAYEEMLRRTNEELEQRVAERTTELAAANEALEEEVAEHEAAKEALLERTQELESIFQALPDLYFRLGPDGTILDHRAGSLAALHVPPSEFEGRRMDQVLPPAASTTLLKGLARARESGRLASVEYALRLPGGEREFEARLVPLADGTFTTVVRDVTERKTAERALRESEEHFRSLIENSSDVATINDTRTGTVLYASPAAERVLGYTPEEMIGRMAPDFVHPDDLPAVGAGMASLLAEPGEPRTIRFRFRRKDGSWIVLETTAHALAVDGNPCFVANARDVTERQEAEEALREATAAAERANRAKSEFLSRMSHELRTPMNSILGFAQLLGRAELSADQRRSVQHILKAGRHLLNLINEVLEIARIEAGRQNLSIEPVRADPLLREALGLVRPLAAQWSVTLEEPAVSGGAFVYADRQRLTQVLLNLLSNAIKYNRPGGSVRLSCEVADAEGGERRLAVRVEDTGRGIPADRVDQLFTPFARLGAEQTEVEGTGLGLALSQRLTEAMGGALTLERSGGEGSVFRLELKRAADPMEGFTAPAAAATSSPEAPLGAATLLYVEDNLANLSLVEAILLSRPNWRTVPALQGQLGVELAREHLPDLILLDLHLPDIPGEEVLRRLRADARTARIPVVVISADATPAAAERLRAAGADAYLTKPIDVDEFLETVDRYVSPSGEEEGR